VIAAEVADHPFDPALLVGAFDAGPAVEAFDAEVRTERDPPVSLDSSRPCPGTLATAAFRLL
jgi:hypothetical protein